MSKVTEKQEKFLQNIVYKGMSQREAYKDAYPNTRAKDKSIDECASRLMKNIKVISRYNELKAQKEGIEIFNLTPAQEKFVERLIFGDSQREAYKNAFNCRKFKDKTIDEKASRLFHTDKIQARYKDLQKKVLAAAEKDAIMSGKEILQRLTEIGRSSLADVIEVKTCKDEILINAKTDMDLKNVKEIYLDKNGNLRVKMHDPIKAIGKLADLQSVKEQQQNDSEKDENVVHVEFANELEEYSE